MKHAPLTRAQLQAIQAKYIDNKEVMTLLREIKRYQQVVLTVRPIFSLWGQTDDGTLDRVEWVQSLVEMEPCVAEHAYDETVATSDGIAKKRNTFPRGPCYEKGFDIG